MAIHQQRRVAAADPRASGPDRLADRAAGGRLSAGLVAASTCAVLAVAGSGLPEAVRAPIVFWFILFCPGLAIVRLAGSLRLAPLLALSIALSIALAGIIATGQVYAGAWSTPLTLAILVGIAFGAVLLDPALMAPRWPGPRLRLLEARVVPVLLLVGVELVVLRTTPTGSAVAGGIEIGAIVSQLAILGGMVAIVAFVVAHGSVAALYTAALLIAAGLPGVVPQNSRVGEASVAAVAYAMALVVVGVVRLARGGGVGWQAVAAALFAVVAGAAAVAPAASTLLPALVFSLAVATVVRGRRWFGAPGPQVVPAPGPRTNAPRRERRAAVPPIVVVPATTQLTLPPKASRHALPAPEAPPGRATIPQVAPAQGPAITPRRRRPAAAPPAAAPESSPTGLVPSLASLAPEVHGGTPAHAPTNESAAAEVPETSESPTPEPRIAEPPTAPSPRRRRRRAASTAAPEANQRGDGGGATGS
jgi:hypothetical protein